MRPKPLSALLAMLLAGVAVPGLQAQPATATTATATAATDPAPVTVSGFWVQGNSLLDAGLLQRTLEPFRGQRSLAELQRAAEAVQALYAAAGWGAVVAYLPPQPVKDGTVTIQVLEGKLGRIGVQGAKRLSAQRVLAALPALKTGQTPALRQIDRQLQLANENPGRQLGVLLGPGTAPGEVDATVKVDEAPATRWNLGLDNTGNQRTGDWRISLGWQHSDLSAADDVLSLQLQTSPSEPDMVRVASLGYRRPLVAWLAALDLYAAYSSIDGGLQGTAAGDLRFAGKGRIAGGRMLWYLPRIGEYDQRLGAGLEYRAYLNNCSITGLPAGACGAAGESVAVLPLTLDWSLQRSGATSGGISLALAHNLGLGGRHGGGASFAAVRPDARRHYTVLRAGANLGLPLPLIAEDWQFALRVAGQYSADRLVSGEQFGLGGAASVRGYEERELAGDTGLQASVELLGPKLAWLGQGSELRLLGFADAGQVSLKGDARCRSGRSSCTLGSVGLGLRLAWDTAWGPLQLKLAVAQAQHDASLTQRGDWRGHLALSASF